MKVPTDCDTNAQYTVHKKELYLNDAYRGNRFEQKLVSAVENP